MTASSAREGGNDFEGHREVTERRRVDPEKQTLLRVTALGGTAVLASYAWFLVGFPELGSEFWGGVPAWMKPGYGFSMLFAATGFFAFTRFVLKRRPPDVKVAGRFGYGVFKWIYALILIPSALWMPLTFAMIQAPGPGTWLAIRVTLGAVGIGSVLLVLSLLRIEPRTPERAHKLAVAGSLAFTFQTAVLDALIWPAYFPA
jgi:hypothetical protein